MGIDGNHQIGRRHRAWIDDVGRIEQIEEQALAHRRDTETGKRGAARRQRALSRNVRRSGQANFEDLLVVRRPDRSIEHGRDPRRGFRAGSEGLL